MLIRDIVRFLPAQLLSPAAQLVSMVLWTHHLAPVQMGLFTLVAATQEIAYTLCLSWFSIYALRNLPPSDDRAGNARYLGTENTVVVASIGASMVAGLVTAVTLTALNGTPGAGAAPAIDASAIGIFFATRALATHYAERARAEGAFLAFTVLQAGGPLGAIAIGLFSLERWGASASVLLAAYAAAQALSVAVALPMLRMRWRLAMPDAATLRAAASFGAPVVGVGLLGWVAENQIRYLVQWQAGAATLGLMVVGWSLGRRCATVTAMLVATAAFPLASRLINEGRRDEAMKQLSLNAAAMLAVLAPVAAALAFIGPALVALTIAPEYRQTTTELIGWAVLGGALRNLHVHVSDQLMVLDRRIALLATVCVFEIAVCAVCTLAGLWLGGLRGALIGQASGSGLALGLSVHAARSRLGLVWPWADSCRILLATAVMSAALWALRPAPDSGGLWRGTLVGSAAYTLAMAALFLPRCRLLALRLMAPRTVRAGRPDPQSRL